MDWIFKPWPWYVTGPLIASVMGLLLYFGRTFGMSSNLRTFCAIGGAGKYSSLFNIRWRDYLWSLTLVLGSVIGGYIAVTFLSDHSVSTINPKTISELNDLGFSNVGHSLVPDEFYGIEAITSFKGISLLIIGGLLVGFGTRYAGGCTSGHAITGLSSLQKPSLIAVIGFFLGGLISVNFILPYIV